MRPEVSDAIMNREVEASASFKLFATLYLCLYISALGRLRQEDLVLEAALDYLTVLDDSDFSCVMSSFCVL